MTKIIIEISDSLRNDFINATKKIQNKYYTKQVMEKNPETRSKILETFMEATNILDRLENGTD